MKRHGYLHGAAMERHGHNACSFSLPNSIVAFEAFTMDVDDVVKLRMILLQVDY